MAERIPVTVLTGFLGSGKTTLLNRILSEHHGQRVAVIENEFGEVGIDQALVLRAEEEVFELNNGCICCTVRGDLIRILGNLLRRRDRFDRVVVETTGMADPGPVAQTFFVDDDVKADYRLDGIVAVVDAKHVLDHLGREREVEAQLAFADVLVLNKLDLVSEEDARAVVARVRSVNRVARLLPARYGDVPLEAVLDVGGFDLSRALATKPTFLEPEHPFEHALLLEGPRSTPTLTFGDGQDPSMAVLALRLAEGEGLSDPAVVDRAVRAWRRAAVRLEPGALLTADLLARGPVALALDAPGPKAFSLELPSAGRWALFLEHRPDEVGLEVPPGLVVGARDFDADHVHDEGVGSVAVHVDAPLSRAKVEAWLGVLLRERGVDLYRTKGILSFAGTDRRFVFQGVHMLFDGREDRPWGDERRASDLVFIGRDLDRAALEAGLRGCVA
jgi:G3E family GTPase